MNRIRMHGKTINVENGKNISITNGKIIIDGREIKSSGKRKIEIILSNSTIENINSNRNVLVKGNVAGDVIAKGTINCDDVGGDITTEGTVNCDNVNGNVSANMINCDDIGGDVTGTIERE